MQKNDLNSIVTARLCNLYHGLFLPQKNILDKHEAIEILETGFLHNNFYGLPLLIPTSLIQKKVQKKLGDTYVWVGNENFARFKIRLNKIFKVELEQLVKKALGTNDMNHPGLQQFSILGDEFIAGSITSMISGPKSKIYLNQLNSVQKMKNLAAIATRNSPHAGHIQIVDYLIKNKFAPIVSLTVSPVPGIQKIQNNKAIQSWLKTKDAKNWHQLQLCTILEHSYLAGPREACTQALMRKNLGASHFVVWRDLSGVNGYYKTYESQEEACRISESIGIEIIKYPGSVFCNECNSAITIGDCDHHSDRQNDISSSEFRKKGIFS